MALLLSFITLAVVIGSFLLIAWAVASIGVGIYRSIIWTGLKNEYQQLRARVFTKESLDERVEEDRVEQLLRAEDPDLMERYTKDYSNIDIVLTAAATAVLSVPAICIGIFISIIILGFAIPAIP